MLAGSLQGKKHVAFVEWISSERLLPGLPPVFDLDDKKQPATVAWREQLKQVNVDGSAFWETERYEIIKGFSYLKRSELIHFYIDREFTLRGMIEELTPVPFEVAVIDSNHDKQWRAVKQKRWGIGRSMADHGLLMGFRGAGHDRLVSRRWLDFGPWRVIRRPDDTTFIQFHDFDVTDPAEAYAQAAPGHQRMGVDPIGGYIQGIDLEVIAGVRGLYLAKTRMLEIVIAPGIEVSQQDMRVACGLRLHHRLNPSISDRIDTIAYVFMDRADAQLHLHELWLRELQCWYVDERGKHRLDDTYHPAPNPPDWVERLNERDANATK